MTGLGSAEPRTAARIAVVGAGSATGIKVREALARRRVPGRRVDLFGTTRGEAVLSDYDGQARLIQEPDGEEIGRCDVVFLCEAPAAVGGSASAGRLVIDLVGATGDEAGARVVHVDLNPEAARDHQGVLAVPHPIAALLAEVLSPLQRSIPLADAVAVVLRPAADFGDDAIEELRDQTVRLLNLAPPPSRIFERQLAFNLLPRFTRGGDRDASLEQARIVRDVSAMLGWSTSRLALTTVAVPVFHGHGAMLRLRPERPSPASEIAKALGRARTSDDIDPWPTPFDLAGEAGVRVGAVEADGTGGAWVWIAAGEVSQRGAELAVRLAESIRAIA